MSSGMPSFESSNSVHQYSVDDMMTPTSKSSRMCRPSSTEEFHRRRSNSPVFEKVTSPVENILFKEPENSHKVLKKVGKIAFKDIVGFYA
jgi:hypothetical protein